MGLYVLSQEYAKWPNIMENILSDCLPKCCINFKRRKLYPANSKYVAKFWFYCSLAGCSLDSTAHLLKSRFLLVHNKHTRLSHTKGEQKSYRSRFVRGEERIKLGESVSALSYPSKEYHRRVAKLDEDSFQAGHLRDTPISKYVVKQCAYEYRKSTHIDKDAIQSVQLLKEKYCSELPGKSVAGFIQFFSINPLTVALWTEKDVELFHQMSTNHSLLVDATGSIVTKLSGKEIFYFAFISFDKSVKTEPLSHIELLTDLSTTNTLKFILQRFLEDEMQRYNYTTFSVPLICTTDFSWPITKSLVETFNKESVGVFGSLI